MPVAWSPGKSAVNARIQKATMALTADAAGAASETTDFISGRLCKVFVDVGTITASATITLTDENGATLFTYTAPASEVDVTYHPSVAANDAAMGAATALEIEQPVCGPITATLASATEDDDPAITVYIDTCD